jgi:hypothetical protein
MNNLADRSIDFAIAMGFGTFPNHFPPRMNVVLSQPYFNRDYGSLSTATTPIQTAMPVGHDAGTGAYTAFYNHSLQAIRKISPGDEIFIDYGDAYFTTRPKLYDSIALSYNYDLADELLTSFRLTVRHELRKTKSARDVEGRNSPNENDDTSKFFLAEECYNLTKDILRLWQSRTLAAMPASVTEVDYVMDVLSSSRNIHDDRSNRDMPWLELHGACLDNLILGNSTVLSAGRGAFSQKFIPSGSILAPVPLVHVPDRAIFNMYGGRYKSPFHILESHPYRRNTSNIIHQQLQLNYCFGHRHSTLLLCPYGAVTSLVNHASDPSVINAKIVWSAKATGHPEWFDMNVDEWIWSVKHSGLAFDYIALRRGME